MPLLDRILPKAPSQPVDVPDMDRRRLARGRDAMRRDAPKRRLCMRFERGDTYFYLNGQGVLSSQNTVTNPDGSGKPPHRIRNSYNLIRPVIQGKVSTATQRTPAYQVLPSTTDQRRVSAAELAEKAARYGYGQWRIGQARQRVAQFAIGGGGEGFAYPYFDPNVGPYTPVPLDPLDPEAGSRFVGRGEIKVLVLNGNEVYWEPGVLFEDSPWWAIERAVPMDEIRNLPGFDGLELVADANTSDIPTDKQPSDQMAMLTEYLVRPTSSEPAGRRMFISNGRVVAPVEKYPLCDPDGQVLDEPAIHRLAWDIDAGLERDFGLTWQLIDVERTIQDTICRISEWKNRCLNPQILAHTNALQTQPTDVPGDVILWQGTEKPEWQPTPAIPDSLFNVISLQRELLALMASDDRADAQASLSNVAAKTMEQVVEQSQARWASFMVQFANFDSHLMRHCLMLCARYYTEPRLLKIKGRDGWERVPDFQGADMLGEVDVRVFSDSLVPQTRQGVQDQITWLNANFPGYLNPQDALAAIQEGSLDRLTESYWLDKARAHEIIQAIRNGTVMDLPSRSQTDPVTGQPAIDPETGEPMDIPGYMPDDHDNLLVWERVFADWMKTDDYARQDQPAQAAARQIWGAIQALKQAKAAREVALQTQMAQDAGLRNAAAPQEPKSMPSLPGSGVPGS